MMGPDEYLNNELPPEGVADPQQRPSIPPQPVPTLVGLEPIVMSNGKPAVQLVVSTPAGLTVVFVDPEAARKIGADLERCAAQAETGIIVPHNGHIQR